MHTLNQKFWEEKYHQNETGWDLGEVSPPLKNCIDQLEDRSQKILIPGAGNAYEAEYLYRKGFENIIVLDIAEAPIENFKRRYPHFPENQILQTDFFDLNMRFDLVLEQTFFCALPPQLRSNYAKKMADLLPQGKMLTGVLFDFPLTEKGPPFGGSKAEYIQYFSPYFDIEKIERAKDSHPDRKGKELFIKMIRK